MKRREYGDLCYKRGHVLTPNNTSFQGGSRSLRCNVCAALDRRYALGKPWQWKWHPETGKPLPGREASYRRPMGQSC
jgi:hypothetical protein